MDGALIVEQSPTSPTAVLEDAYPLTSMQNGILFHTLRVERPGPYIEQFVFDGVGDIDAARLSAAWTSVVNRHTALRTAFVWEGVAEPMQVVVGECRPPLTHVDLTGLDPVDVEDRLREFLRADRANGFVLTEAPLMRLTLMSHDRGVVLVWTLHHLIMDGWSLPITVDEVAATYRAASGGKEPDLPPAPKFRDYLDWLLSQDAPAAERFWRDRLAGTTATDLRSLLPGAPEERRGQARDGRAYHQLSPQLTAALVSLARDSRVTLGTVFQLAWALVLAGHTDRDDVTFGTTVSGRPADLAGVEDLVGVCINTIPQRVRLAATDPVRIALRSVHRGQLDSTDFHHIGLPDLLRLSGLAAGATLFDSIIVFENYPGENPSFDLGSGSRLVIREIIEDAGYPLTLTVLPRHPQVGLQLLYDDALYADDTALTVLGRLDAVLSAMVDSPNGAVADIAMAPQPPPPAAVRVVDRHGKPTAVGVWGTVSGDGASASRAGDRARYRADGEIEYAMAATATDPGSAAPVPAPPELDRPAGALVRTLWEQILGRAVIDGAADFFRLGGDSLAAVRLVGRMRPAFGDAVRVADVFQHRTLGALLSFVDERMGSRAAADGAADNATADTATRAESHSDVH